MFGRKKTKSSDKRKDHHEKFTERLLLQHPELKRNDKEEEKRLLTLTLRKKILKIKESSSIDWSF